MTQIIIREVPRSRSYLRLLLSMLGIAFIAVGVVSGFLVNSDTAIWISGLVALAVIALGWALLQAWRHSGEREYIDISAQNVRLMNSLAMKPLFEASLGETRVQRVKHSLGMRLCLRSQDQAYEFANHLPVEEREKLAEEIEGVLIQSHAEK